MTNNLNTARATTNRLVWTVRNQITNMTGSSTASYLYDGFGRRISRTVNGATQRYHYDGRGYRSS